MLCEAVTSPTGTATCFRRSNTWIQHCIALRSFTDSSGNFLDLETSATYSDSIISDLCSFYTLLFFVMYRLAKLRLNGQNCLTALLQIPRKSEKKRSLLLLCCCNYSIMQSSSFQDFKFESLSCSNTMMCQKTALRRK